MMEGTPTSGPALVGSELEDSAEKNYDSPETVEMTCLCCSVDRFRFLRHFHSEGETWARWECVGCGAISDRRVPFPRGEGA